MTTEYEYEYETGPFCRHYSDPTDCKIACANCGCLCPNHDSAEGSTECNNCGDCKAWVEPAD